MYKIRFADNSEFIGGEPQNSGWNEMPDKPIAVVQYSLFGVEMAFKGFEAYNHVVENVVILNNNTYQASQPTRRISKIILMGKWQQRFYEAIFDLDKGSVYQRVRFKEQRYTGWRRGEFDPGVHPKIKRY